MATEIFGTSGDDEITPGSITAGVSGFPTSGLDVIHGDEGNDTIDGGGGEDDLYGGLGDDLVYLSLSLDYADGGDGIDTLDTSVETTAILVNLATNTAGSAGDTVLNFENVRAGLGNDTLIGTDLANLLSGGGGRDSLRGGLGNDTLIGLAGNDRLIGGKGTDVLIGGGGSDVFIFDDGDSLGGPTSDRIGALTSGGSVFDGAGAAAGDLIDLSRIDADRTTAGDQAFVFGGKGIGHLIISEGISGFTVISANVNGNRTSEFYLVIADGAVPAGTYTAADFIL